MNKSDTIKHDTIIPHPFFVIMHLYFYLKVKPEETAHTHTQIIPRSPSWGERTVRLNYKAGTFISQDSLSYAAVTTYKALWLKTNLFVAFVLCAVFSCSVLLDSLQRHGL